MGGRLSLTFEIIETIKKSTSFAELKYIRESLMDETQTYAISNRRIHEALTLVKEKINSMDKDEIIKEILEDLLW